MSKVFFASLSSDRQTKNAQNQIIRLFRRAGMAELFGRGEFVALKTHFGEPGSITFLRPQFAAQIADLVGSKGARPFLTDSNTLYIGGRSNAVDHLRSTWRHGYVAPTVNAPIIIADGLRGLDQVDVRIDLKNVKTAKVGSAAMQADSIVGIAHVKGHILTGFGGAIKNIGMGFGSRAGKLEMHHDISLKVEKGKCKACGLCAKYCPAGAITVKGKAKINPELCVGCGECYVACVNQAINPGAESAMTATQEKIVEYAYAVLNDRKDKCGFFNFIMDFTPHCDCPPWSDTAPIANIGILASKDIVAIDQASADLVNRQALLPGTDKVVKNKKGKDILRSINDIDWTRMLEYGEELGLGSRKYELIKV